MSITQPGLPEPQCCPACQVPMGEKAGADGVTRFFCHACGGFVHLVPRGGAEPLVVFLPAHLSVSGESAP